MKYQVSQIYILWTPQNSLKIQHPKNLIVKNFNKLFAKIAFLLLFKCNFFFPNCSSLMLLFSIYPILVCEQFFNILFTSWTFLSRSFFYFLILKLEKTVLVFGEVCLNFFDRVLGIDSIHDVIRSSMYNYAIWFFSQILMFQLYKE